MKKLTQQYLALPALLQRYAAVGTALALGAFSLAVFALCRINWMVSLPMLFAGVGMLVRVVSVLGGKYLQASGKCVKIERNITHTCPKWIILKNEQCALRIRCSKRQFQVQLGDLVTVYLRPGARMYEMDGVHIVQDYIAIKAEGVLQDGQSGDGNDAAKTVDGDRRSAVGDG